MTDLSIRQTAEKLSVSHTAVRNAIADIEAETGIKLGTSQGAGKATLLNEAEQELIAQQFYAPAAQEQQPEAGQMVLSGGLTYGIPGLTRVQPKTAQFNLEEIAAAKQQYQQAGQQGTLDAAQLVQQYAMFKAVQTIQEIDAVFEGIKAGAINQSVDALGKGAESAPSPQSA